MLTWTHTRTYTHTHTHISLITGVKVDIYSATMVLYFVITGQLPFKQVHPNVIGSFTARGQARSPLNCIKNKDIRDLLGFLCVCIWT